MGIIERSDLSRLLEHYFSDCTRVVEHQISSFNFFVEERVPYLLLEKIGEFRSTTTPLEVEFKEVEFKKPTMENTNKPLLPIYCRLTNGTYSGEIIAKVKVRCENSEHEETISIGKFPVMVKSKLCWLHGLSEDELAEKGEDPTDQGGYFIVNGHEYTIISSMDIGDNRIIVRREGSEEDKANYIAEIFSQGEVFKNPLLPINELSPRGKTQVILKSSSIFYVSFPRVITPVPLIYLVKFLGIDSDEEIFKAIDIGHEDSSLIVLKNIEKFSESDPEELYKQISRHMMRTRAMIEDSKSRTLNDIRKFLLPHIGTDDESNIEKARMLLYMARKTLELKYGLIEEVDKDHLMVKKVKPQSKLLEMIFEDAVRRLLIDLESQANGYYRRHGSLKNVKLKSILRSYIFTGMIQQRFGIGQWPDMATGISQLIQQPTNRFNVLSYLRKISATHLNKKLTHLEVRDFHGTHFGRIDPSHTPEGSSLGLNVFYALLSRSTEGLMPKEDKKVLEQIKELMVKKYGKTKR